VRRDGDGRTSLRRIDPFDGRSRDLCAHGRAPQGAGFGGPYAALTNHPLLCEKIEDLGYFLKFEGHLPRDVYQFVVLCVARKTGAEFEWIDHIKHAEEAGVPQEIIDALRRDESLESIMSQPYGLVARLLSATLLWKNIPKAVQDEAVQRFGVDGLVELVVLSGFYQMFSAINQGFVAPPEGAPKRFG
jgi:4-carboxymuconolactone decarboxylase